MLFTFLQSHQEVYCRHQGGSYVCEGICLPWGSISQDTWCKYRSNAANVFKPFEKLRFTCMNTATMFSCYFFFIKFQLRAALKDFTRAIHLRPDVHHYYMYRVNILWYTCVLSSDSNTVWIILNISFTLSTPTVCDSLFFTGPVSAGARKSGDGRFLCQVRNLYFFHSIKQYLKICSCNSHYGGMFLTNTYRNACLYLNTIVIIRIYETFVQIQKITNMY